MGERGIEGERKQENERVSHKEPAKMGKIKKLKLDIRESNV